MTYLVVSVSNGMYAPPLFFLIHTQKSIHRYVVVGSNKTKVEKLTFNVTAGSTYTVDFADQIAILENYQTTGYITFQITGYKEFSIAPQK